jgi:glutaredoxin
MRASFILRQQWSLRLTLFVRQNCSLCTDAKDVMSKVWDRRPFEYTEIDVMAANQTKWKNLYEFDTPVVRLKSDLNNNKQD